MRGRHGMNEHGHLTDDSDHHFESVLVQCWASDAGPPLNQHKHGHLTDDSDHHFESVLVQCWASDAGPTLNQHRLVLGNHWANIRNSHHHIWSVYMCSVVLLSSMNFNRVSCYIVHLQHTSSNTRACDWSERGPRLITV